MSDRTNQSGQGLMTQLGKLVETLEKVVFRTPAAEPKAEPAPVASPSLPDGRRLLRGLGEALERIAAREAEEATRTHAAG